MKLKNSDLSGRYERGLNGKDDMDLVEEVERSANIKATVRGGLRLISFHDIPAFLEAVSEAGFVIIGIEGFILVEHAIRPDMNAIADFSELTDSARSVEEAQRFFDEISHSKKHFDFVLRER